MTGKMHLFGMTTQHQHTPDYVKAYYFIKLAAEIYEVAECRYYLGVMYNFKMTPHFTISHNLALKQNKSPSEILLERFTNHMHLTHCELNLYLASLESDVSAMMVLANQNRRGISTTKNCTAAALYYTDIVKRVYVEDFLQHSFFRDKKNFKQ
jgi:hypothetical protein